MAKQITIPKTLGACADMLYELRDKRLALSRQVDEIKKQETAIANHLIDNLPKSDAKGVVGRVARAVVQTKIVAQVKDWEPFYAFIRKSKDFSLMQRRVNEAAVKERWEAGKAVPGVEPFNVVKVSVTKA